MRDVRIDHAAMTRDDDALPEGEARLRVRIHVPRLLAQHTFPHSGEHAHADVAGRRLVRRNVAENPDLAKIVNHDRLEAMMSRDLASRLERALQWTRVHRVHLRDRE